VNTTNQKITQFSLLFGPVLRKKRKLGNKRESLAIVSNNSKKCF
jgi:hypothetical protein